MYGSPEDRYEARIPLDDLSVASDFPADDLALRRRPKNSGRC